MTRAHQEWAHRTIELEETARQSSQALEGAPVRPLLAPAHFSYSVGTIRLRCVDFGPRRRTQFNCDLSAVRSPV